MKIWGPCEDAARELYYHEHGENDPSWEELDESTKQFYREAS